MWTEPTMPFGTSFIVSVMGMVVVFLALIVLALAVMLISKLLRTFLGGSEKPAAAAAAPAPAVSDEADKELLAVLMATIGEDLGLPANQFRIVSVKEIG